MERMLMQDLLRWKDSEYRKPLILWGARQVGKTWLMKEFGAKFYKKTAYISFYNNSELKKVFDTDYDINRILSFLNIAAGFPITPGDTLIIFDEIQNAPKAFESLKYFCIVPIEVKAETNVRSQSLKAFHEKYKPDLSVRFSLLPYRDQGWMTNIPLYAVHHF